MPGRNARTRGICYKLPVPRHRRRPARGRRVLAAVLFALVLGPAVPVIRDRTTVAQAPSTELAAAGGTTTQPPAPGAVTALEPTPTAAPAAGQVGVGSPSTPDELKAFARVVDPRGDALHCRILVQRSRGQFQQP